MKFKDIHIRDPFVVPYDGKYYLYGTRGPTVWGVASGLDVYVSDDLENWSDAHECFAVPENFWADKEIWAPEVHLYNGKFYMFYNAKDKDENGWLEQTGMAGTAECPGPAVTACWVWLKYLGGQ